MTLDVKREAVAHLYEAQEVSQRLACQFLEICRSTLRYGSIRPDDADFRKAIWYVPGKRRQFGCHQCSNYPDNCMFVFLIAFWLRD